MAELDDTLAELTALLPALNSEDTIQAAAKPFCDGIFTIFCAVQDGMTRGEYQKVLDFLSESSKLLTFGFGYLGQDLIHRMDRLLDDNWQGLEWITLCELRSTFEALKDLYEDYLQVEYLSPEIDSLDERIESKGEVEAIIHPQLTPTNFPEDHWWWILD